MLKLTRKRHEKIYIGDNIIVTVIKCKTGRVRLGIEAPKNIKVHRQEVYDDIKNGVPRKPNRPLERGSK